MFAPDHERAARVCRAGGYVATTTWVNGGFAGELFRLTGSFLPPPPVGVQPPPLWGVESPVHEVFEATGVTPGIAHETIELAFPSEADMVDDYAANFGPFVTARAVLEPQGRWAEFVQAFADLVRRFNLATDGTARVPAEYLLIIVERERLVWNSRDAWDGSDQAGRRHRSQARPAAWSRARTAIRRRV
jgi:hypothetical protein